METDQPTWLGTVKYIVLALLLAAMAVALGAVVVYAARGAQAAGPEKREYLYYLAWTCLVLLGLVVVALVWIVARFVAYRAGPPRPWSRTPYIDAWSLAGKRFRLKKQDRQEDDKEEGDGGS